MTLHTAPFGAPRAESDVDIYPDGDRVVVDDDGPPQPSSETLTKSIDIDVVLAERKQHIERVHVAAEAMRRTGIRLRIDNRGRWSSLVWPDGEAVDQLVREYDSEKWWQLLKRSGLYTFLDTKARDAWKTSLDSGEFPPLDADSIKQTFAKLYEERAVMFERGVVELYRQLDFDYRTNSPRMLGKRLVVSHGVERAFGRAPSSRVTFSFCNRLDDLLRVMAVLDGKPEPEHSKASWSQLREWRPWPQPAPDADVSVAGDVYLRCRGFKNGNAHVTFVRLDLVEKMNRIIARHYPNALPPSEACR